MRNSVDIAREVVVSYFETLANKDALNATGYVELLNLKFDETNKVLLEHLVALRNIFDDAIREIEGENNGTE